MVVNVMCMSLTADTFEIFMLKKGTESQLFFEYFEEPFL